MLNTQVGKLFMLKFLTGIFILQTSRSSSVSSSLDQESSADDFLARMDSSIASVKKEVKRAQGNSE